MRKINDKNTKQKRESILKAALQCFAEKGLQKASIQDICHIIGMRPGHLYYYFPTRNSIIEDVYKLGTEEMIVRIENMLEAGDFLNSLVDVHADAETYRRTWNISPGLRLEFQAETARNAQLKKIYEEQEARTSEATLSAVRKAIAVGQLSDRLDPIAFSRAVGLLWSGFASLRIVEGFDLEDYREAIKILMDPWMVKTNAAAG